MWGQSGQVDLLERPAELEDMDRRTNGQRRRDGLEIICGATVASTPNWVRRYFAIPSASNACSYRITTWCCAPLATVPSS